MELTSVGDFVTVLAVLLGSVVALVLGLSAPVVSPVSKRVDALGSDVHELRSEMNAEIGSLRSEVRGLSERVAVSEERTRQATRTLVIQHDGQLMPATTVKIGDIAEVTDPATPASEASPTDATADPNG